MATYSYLIETGDDMALEQVIPNKDLPVDADGKVIAVPLKVNVIKVFRWQCPHCLRDNMETEVPTTGLLYCKCTRVLQISSIDDDKIFYLNNRKDEDEYYLLRFDDHDHQDEIFTDVKAAIERFTQAKDSWTCQLFGILMRG